MEHPKQHRQQQTQSKHLLDMTVPIHIEDRSMGKDFVITVFQLGTTKKPTKQSL